MAGRSAVVVTAFALICVAGSAPAASGDLDPTFGIGGKVTTKIPDDRDGNAMSIVRQPDGKLVAAGSASVGTIDFQLIRYDVNGLVDPSFGTAGQVTTSVGAGADGAAAIVRQPDGKLVAAGYSSTGTYNDFALVRYNADGTLDTGFGTGGIATTPVGDGDDGTTSLVLQPDGKLVAAGYSQSSGNYDFALVRYNADGTLDTGFGTGGKVVTPIGPGEDEALALVRQPDGKLVAAGHSWSGTSFDFALARYTTGGALDASFGTGGKVTTAIGDGTDLGTAVALQPDGKLVIGGLSFTAGLADFALARFSATGALDTAFGTGGKLRTSFGGVLDGVNSLVVLPDGKIVAGGSTGDGGPNSDFALARYSPDGTLDSTFGSDGKLVTSFGTGDTAQALLLQPDGKLVAAGSRWNGFHYEFALARYLGEDPRISIGDASITEGLSGTTNLTFTVSLTGAAQRSPVSVDFATADGTAFGAQDYQSATGTLTFTGGQTSQRVSVAIVGDALHEGDERFSVTLSNASNASIRRSEAVGTVVDDDPAVLSGPVSAGIGAPVALAGSGFGINERVDLRLDALVVGSVATTVGGTFTANIQVPASVQPGPHLLVASGERSGWAASRSLLVQTDWPQFHNSANRRGYGINENTIAPGNIGDLDLAWSALQGGAISSSPVVAGGIVYSAGGTADKRLRGYNTRTGAGLFSPIVGTLGTGTGTPAVAGGRVFVAGADGKIYAFNALTGAPLWAVAPGTAGPSPAASPLAANGLVYVGLNDGLAALNPATGATVWSSPSGAINSAPAYAGGIVYATSADGKLYAFGANGCGGPTSCAPMWGTTIGTSLTSSPTVAGGVVYAGSDNGRLYTFLGSCVAGCAPLWVSATVGPIASPPAVARGRVYVGSDDRHLYAFPATSLCPTSCPYLWRSGDLGGRVRAAPAFANGLVFVGSTTDVPPNPARPAFSALDAATGATLWSYSGQGAYFDSSPALADGMVYVGSSSRRLYAFGLNGAAPGAPLPASAPLTTAPLAVGTTAATLGGIVEPGANAIRYWFDYGRTTAYGRRTRARALGVGLEAQFVAAKLKRLKPNTRYAYRLVVAGPDGLHLGANRSFRTHKLRCPRRTRPTARGCRRVRH